MLIASDPLASWEQLRSAMAKFVELFSDSSAPNDDSVLAGFNLNVACSAKESFLAQLLPSEVEVRLVRVLLLAFGSFVKSPVQHYQSKKATVCIRLFRLVHLLVVKHPSFSSVFSVLTPGFFRLVFHVLLHPLAMGFVKR